VLELFFRNFVVVRSTMMGPIFLPYRKHVLRRMQINSTADDSMFLSEYSSRALGYSTSAFALKIWKEGPMITQKLKIYEICNAPHRALSLIEPRVAQRLDKAEI